MPFASMLWGQTPKLCFPHNPRALLALKTHKKEGQGFSGGTVVESPPANTGDTGSIPGPGRSHMLQSN